jgi:hypothetical protein
LKTLAEGVSDPRFEVQQVSVEALFTAVLDRHSAVVPSSVLIDVIGEVLVPVVNNLGLNCVVSRTMKHDNLLANNKSSFFLRENWMRVEMKERAVHEELDLDITGTDDLNFDRVLIPSDSDVGFQQSLELFEKSMNNLTVLFARHVKRLSVFPSFDRLWIRLLGLFGILTTDRSEIETSNSTTTCQLLFEYVNDIARKNLRTLLTLMMVEKIFVLRKGLLSITQDEVSRFQSCSTLSKEVGLFNDN